MGKGSNRRKEDYKRVEDNLGKVKFGTFKPSRTWETKEPKRDGVRKKTV